MPALLWYFASEEVLMGYEFIDALAGAKISQDENGDTTIERDFASPGAKSIFFPGCSYINYAMPLVAAVYETLSQHDAVDGISLLCCGKILSYEPDGDDVRSAFESQLRDHVHEAGIERIICACPNCVRALREALAEDPRTKEVDVVALPVLLADIGYRLDQGIVNDMILGSQERDAILCVHDSCPDREVGEFARGIRAMMPDSMWVDPKHCRSKSVCCGSLPRAAGKIEAADKCANLNGEESVEAGADSIVTSCMSCAFQLNMAQAHIQCVTFLELMYSWRVDWATVGGWMKLRFLFDETLGATPIRNRNFASLDSQCENEAACDVGISDCNTEDIGI